MHQHSIDEQFQITMEAVEEANTEVGRKLHLWDGKSPLMRQGGGSDQLQQEAAEEQEELECRQAEIKEEESRQADEESSQAEPGLSELPDAQRDHFRPEYHQPARLQTSQSPLRFTPQRPTKDSRGPDLVGQ
jgi:hypothetical protein